MTNNISTFTEVTLLQDYEYEGKKHYIGEKCYLPNSIAIGLVRRGRAEYKDNYMATYPVSMPKVRAKPKPIVIKPIITKPIVKDFIPSRVSIIVIIIEEVEVFTKCLKSLKNYTDNYELIVVSNGSSKETLKFLEDINWIDFTLVINKENKGIPYAWNQGIKVAKYDYMCFLNSDTIVTPNWLDKLMKCFKDNKDCGICGPTTSFCGGIQCDRRVMDSRFTMTTDQINKFASNLKDGYMQREVMGFCFVVKNKVFKDAGVFDYKRFKLGNTEEREFIWRAEQLGNHKSYWVKGAYVHHFGHITFKELGIDPYTYNKKARVEWEINKHLVKSKFIENDVELGKISKHKIDIYKSKKVVVTANIGKYDNVIEKHYFNSDYNFILFTDDKDIKSSLWKLIYVKSKLEDLRRESRAYKWLIHRFFPDVKYSLWIDSNIVIKGDINTMIEKYLNNTDIALHLHGERNCIYKEAELCIERKFDYVELIRKQIQKYKAEGYPENNGLHEGTVILRRHTEDIKRFDEAVWAEICSGSTRDQLSLNYIAWKLGIKITDIPGSLITFNSEDFSKLLHLKSTRGQYSKR